MSAFAIAVLVISGIVLILFLMGATLIWRSVRAAKQAVNSTVVRTAAEVARELLSDDGAFPEIASEQKPRSVSDLSGAFLDDIARDFPDLNVNELISAAEVSLSTLLESTEFLQSGGIAGVDNDAVVKRLPNDRELPLPVSAPLVNRIVLDAGASGAGTVTHCERVRIHRTGLFSYRKREGTCTISLQTALEYFYYVTQNGNMVSGSKDTIRQTRFTSELLYVFDEEYLASGVAALSAHCPNCGAPVTGTGQKQCPYCGSLLRTVDMRLWRLNNIREG